MTPRHAEKMLLHPRSIRCACDPFRNPQFLKADARTRDFRGLRLLDYLDSHDAVDEAAEDLRRVVVDLLDGRAVDLDPLRMSEIPRTGQSPRVVFVATYPRRCLSNLISNVLASTTATLLPKSVRAYVPGALDPVPDAVLDLAEAVRHGRIRWWWKIDFRAFFASVSHSLIEEALRHYGFTDRVVRLVLACVRTPVHRRVAGGGWGRVPNSVGAPMGLAESSVLANLATFSFDEYFEGVRNRITHVRYSDDILGGARLHQEAVGAVRHIRKWTEKYGIQIKGMSAGQRTTTLVHDIRADRMPALGVEIDHDGCIHIPHAKLAAKLQDIDTAMAALGEHDPDPLVNHPVVEQSVYAGGRGTDFRDLDDIRASAEAFESYWKRFNLAEAEAFRAEVNRRHPDVFSQRRSGTVWIVSLGGLDGAGGGGPRPPAPLSNTPSPRQGSPLTRSPGQGEGSIAAGSEPGEGNTRRDARMVDEVEDSNDHLHGLYDDPVLGFRLRHEEEAGLVSDALRREGVDDEAVEVEDRSWSEIDTDEEGDEVLIPGSDGEICSSQVAATIPSPDQRSGTGNTYEPGSPEPPRSPVLDNFVWIATRKVPHRKGGPGALVGMLWGDPDAPGAPNAHVTVTTLRPEVALVKALERVVQCVALRGGGRLDVHVEPTWLPKHLVVRGRRFHAPLIFAAIVRIHRTAERARLDLRVHGGDDVPAALEERLSARLRYAR